jgi:hypothetical protein
MLNFQKEPLLSSSKKIKSPTMREKIEMYERVLHDLHFHRTVTMNHAAINEILNKIGEWSRAHSGEFSSDELTERVNATFWNLRP